MSIISKLNRIKDVKDRLMLLLPQDSQCIFEELPDALGLSGVEYHIIEEQGIYIVDSQGNIGMQVSTVPTAHIAYLASGVNFSSILAEPQDIADGVYDVLVHYDSLLDEILNGKSEE